MTTRQTTTNNGSFQLSVDQKKAVSYFDKSVGVLAGAGSGKTTVLVERFLYAITQKGIDPERILAITFTKKAATQMKTRLVAECNKRGLDTLRWKLENTSISTIDSFCARVLKEHPVEAGIDPEFIVLAQEEADILSEKILDRVLESQGDHEEWCKLVADYGEDKIRRAIKSMYAAKHNHLSDKTEFSIKSDTTFREAARQAMLDEAEEILKLSGAGRQGGSKNAQACAELLSFLKEKSEENWSCVDRLKEIKGGLKKIGTWADQVGQLKENLDRYIGHCLEAMAEGPKAELVRVFSMYEKEWDQYKRETAAYDFGDLLYLSYQLLSGTSPIKAKVRNYYQNYFEYVMVDEFQDTSPLQSQIIQLVSRNNNMFVVGDLQQAIYGFRQADPEAFKEFIAMGQKESGRLEVLSLDDNYRSRPEILYFANSFFSQVLPKDEFRPLRPQRSVQTDKTFSIEFLGCADKQKEAGSTNRYRVLEAKRLAQRIRQMLDEKMVLEDAEGKRRPIKYRDIAILLRTTTSAWIYEKELKRLSIPCTLSRGRGFYEKIEIKDMVNLLKVIQSPWQDIPLAGVLRSPLGQISVDALFWLSYERKNISKSPFLFDCLKQCERNSEMSSADAQRCQRVYELIQSFRKIKDRLPLPQLIEAILLKTQFKAHHWIWEDGLQRVANLLKLTDKADVFEQSGLSGLGAFIQYLESMTDPDFHEAEAIIQGDHDDAVLLSTIHAAKGLEFPCVILADMDARGRGNSSDIVLVDKALHLGLKLGHPVKGERQADESYRQLAEEKRLRNCEESNRLFYVAVTRAKEHLILSGTATQSMEVKDSKLSWMRKLMDAIRHEDAKSTEDFFTLNDVRIKKLSLDGPDSNGDNFTDIKVSDSFVSKESLIDSRFNDDRTNSFVLDKTIEKKWIMPQKPFIERKDLTVSDILARQSREIKNRLAVFTEDSEGAERYDYGIIFHRAMETLVRAYQIKRLRFNPKSLRFFAAGLGPNQAQELKDSVARCWKGFLRNELKNSQVSYPELPFIYKTAFGLLKGQMDLVYQNISKEWTILDYKTHRIEPEEKGQAAEGSRLQIMLYAYVFGKLYGQYPSRGIIYFSSISDWQIFDLCHHDFAELENVLQRFFKKK